MISRGIFIAAAAPSFKEKDRDLIAWYQREILKYPIEVKLNTEVKNVETLQADEVIVATGAVARTIPVKGVEHAMDAAEYLLGEKEVGENVTIIGGGLTGCEIAYDLYLQGKKPTIVEMKNDLIAVKGICLANTSKRDLQQKGQAGDYRGRLEEGCGKNGKSLKRCRQRILL